MTDGQYIWLAGDRGLVFGAGSKYRVGEVTGLLSAPPRRAGFQNVHNRHGAVKSGPRTYDLRRVQMAITVESTTTDEVEGLLDDLQAAFIISEDEGVLVSQRRTKTARALRCSVSKSEFVANYDAWTGMIKGVVEFEALDPLFYEFNLLGDPSATLKPPPADAGRTYPLVYPRTYPAAALLVGSLTNSGTIESFITATITGPLSNPRIKNNTTGEVFGLNMFIQAGETVQIDMRTHAVFKTDGTPLRGRVDAYSTWLTLPPGQTCQFVLLGGNATSETTGTVSGLSAWPTA